VKRPALEILAVLLTGIVFLIFENLLHLKMWFLIPCVLAWTAYIVTRDRARWREWGVRRDNLARASWPAAVVFVALAGGMIAWKGWRPLPEKAWVVFVLYPIWGFLQQFMVQGLIANNLRAMAWPRAAIVGVAAVAFGLAHLPDWPLVGLCAGAGGVWTLLFLREPNLWPIALSHAWMGALAYYWILERNPWNELMKNG